MGLHPLVVLVLPLGMGEESSEELRGAFSNHCVNVISSSNLERFLSQDQSTDLIKGIVGDSKPRSITVVGYCSGAGLAINLVAVTELNIDILILVAGEFLTGEPSHQTDFSRGMDQILKMALRSQREAEVVSNSMRKMREMMSDSDAWALANFNPFQDGAYLYFYAQAYHKYKKNNYLELAHAIDNEVHFVYGKSDEVVSSKAGENMLAIFQKTKIWFEEGDHKSIFHPCSQITQRVLELTETKHENIG